jgi:hypothetical protein
VPFPKTRDEMIAAGYKFQNVSRCKACQAEIEWFETPRAKKMPFNEMPSGNSLAISHFSTCPEADLFRKEK